MGSEGGVGKKGMNVKNIQKTMSTRHDDGLDLGRGMIKYRMLSDYASDIHGLC